MAINFLNTVNLNKNQLAQAAIESQPNDAAAGAAPVEGQVYFNTTDFDLRIYANGAWKEVGATSGVETFTNTSGAYVAFGTDNASATGNVTVGTVDLTAVDGTSTAADRFLTKANKWATIPFGDITEVQGGTYINVTNQTGPVPIVNHDLTTRTDTTSTVSANVFPVVDSVSTNTTGHVTAINVKTVTVPDNNTTYELSTAPTGTAVRLTAANPSDTDDVTISGTAGRTAISRISTTELRVDLTDDVIIIDDLTVGGVITQTQAGELNTFSSKLDMGGTGSVTPNKIINLATGTAATDAVNLGQVELLVAGVGVFQGGYNATTGLTVPGGGELDGTSNIALDKGDYFVVTTAGTAFFGLSLEPGDFIFAETAIAANSNPPVGDYIVVRADDNVAGAGATDGATQKGVSGFDSENFTVSSNGWVQLKPLANPYGAKVALTGGDNTTAGQTTFTVDVTALFGATADARNCKVEVLLDAGGLTVYPEVTRNGTGDVLLEFMPQVGNSIYSALITIV